MCYLKKNLHLFFPFLFFTSLCFSQSDHSKPLVRSGGINDLLLDQGNLIAATSQGIYIYRDNGSVIEKRETSIKNKDVGRLIKHSKILYAGSWDTIYRSTNGGMIWDELVTFPKQLVYCLSAHPSIEGKLYAGLSDGIYMSTNYGNSWKQITNMNIPVFSILVHDSSVYVFAANEIFFRMDSRTETMIAQTKHSLGKNFFVSQVFDERDSALILSSYHGLFKSTNYGRDWIKLYSGGVFSLVKDPAGLVYGGTANGFVISIDGTTLNNSPILREGPVNALIREGNTFFAGMATGEIYSSHDEGKSWEPFSEGLADPYVAEITFSQNQFYASTQTRGVFRSKDGIQWMSMNLSFPYAPLEPSSGGTVTSIIVNQNEIVTATPFHGVYRSTDEGITWLPFNEGLPLYEVYRVASSVSRANEYFALAGRGFYRLRPTATEWEAFTPSLPDSDIVSFALGINPRTRKEIYLCGTGSGEVFVFREEADQWVQSKKGLAQKIYIYETSVINRDDTNLMFLGTVDGIYRSANLGESWEYVYELKQDALNYGVLTFASDSTHLFAGTAGGNLLVSTDNGVSWMTAETGIVDLKQIWRIVIQSDILWIATLGSGLHQVSLSQLKFSSAAEVTAQTPPSPPHEFELLQNYPNPFNTTTTFVFSIAEPRVVLLTVYDIVGREIETVLEKELQPDTYRIPWHASTYASGVYFLRMKAGSYVSTKKMTIVK